MVKYQIRKVWDSGDSVAVEVEFKETIKDADGHTLYDEGDRFTHGLPKSIDWEEEDPRTGNTRLYERMQKVVNMKTRPRKANTEHLKRWQNLQFNSDN